MRQDLRVKVDAGSLIEKLEWLDQKQTVARRLLRWLRLSQMEITYENLLANPNEFFQVCDYLSINAEKSLPISQISRIRTKNLADTLINYDEVRRVVLASRFASLLEENEYSELRTANSASSPCTSERADRCGVLAWSFRPPAINRSMKPALLARGGARWSCGFHGDSGGASACSGRNNARLQLTGGEMSGIYAA